LSVIVNDLDLLWPSIGPHEADPPLVVDSDAVLPGSIAFQRLKPITGRDSQVVKNGRGSHLAKLPQRHRMDPRIDRRHPFTTPQSLCVIAAERPDHAIMI